jgi:hypothetical protein
MEHYAFRPRLGVQADFFVLGCPLGGKRARMDREGLFIQNLARMAHLPSFAPVFADPPMERIRVAFALEHWREWGLHGTTAGPYGALRQGIPHQAPRSCFRANWHRADPVGHHVRIHMARVLSLAERA